jgi:Tfp pilus assembly protein PilO
MIPSEVNQPQASRFLSEYYGSFCIGLILMFICAVGLILKPKFDFFRQTNIEIGAQTSVFNQEQAYVTSLEESVAAAESIAPAVLTHVDEALPREARIPELLVLLDQAAQKNQLRMLNVSFAENTAVGRNTTSSAIGEVAITLTVQASDYLQLKRFLGDLERSLRLIDVTGLHVAIGSGGETAYALQLKAYTYAPSVRSTPTALQRNP